MRPDSMDGRAARTMTLEALADTIIPGEKRGPDDAAIAGAATGPGAVAAGAVELLETSATGISQDLDVLVRDLNEHVRAYADQHGRTLDDGLPPFVALSFDDRTALVTTLTAPGHPEREVWVLLSLFSYMAFDTGAHMHTLDAIAEGHPGLATLGIAMPDPDGLWRFPKYSYGRQLAAPHPDTDATGSLA